MADDHAPGEAHKDEPINDVIPTSYHKDRGAPAFGGAELASDGPVHESTVSVTPVPGSPAADGVHAGLVGDAQQDVQSDAPVRDHEDNTGQNMLKSERRSRRND